MTASIIKLKAGKEKSLRRLHPWVFSGAINSIEGKPKAGADVMVQSAHGEFLGWGTYSPESQISVRVFSFEESKPLSDTLIKERIEAALSYRKQVVCQDKVSAYRIIASESDGLPGLIVDKYGDFLVCQFLTVGVERLKLQVVNILRELLTPRGIFERSDVDVREKEGLTPVVGLLWGEAPPAEIEITEYGTRYLIDVHIGHKTGFYLDQRENRRRLQDFSNQKEVLNCFSYTGGFGLSALAGGAKFVTNVDASQPALDISSKQVALNGLDSSRVEHICDDVFKLLRTYRDSRRFFDVIVLDPPKFIESKGQLEKGARGYKDINLLAFKLLRPGGILFTFSCSGLMPPDLFQKIVADAALDAGRTGRIIEHLEQSPCHPVRLSFPEGQYLKGLVVQVE